MLNDLGLGILDDLQTHPTAMFDGTDADTHSPAFDKKTSEIILTALVVP